VKNSPKTKTPKKIPSLSLNRQLKLLSISKTAYYYTKKNHFQQNSIRCDR